MVLLTGTEAVRDAVKTCEAHGLFLSSLPVDGPQPGSGVPSEGQPISHTQILSIHKQLDELHRKGVVKERYDLNTLLRGTAVWTEPPKPKPEPSDEYKALMARLRAEQEAESYARMLYSTSSAPPQAATAAQSFAQRFPTSPYANLFPDSRGTLPTRLASAGQIPSQFSPPAGRPGAPDSVVYDDATFATVNRQLALIANVLISVIATAVAIWWATWHWETTARLGVSMGGSGIVGVAEVVVYLGYIQRLDNAKASEKAKKEVRKVTKTWVIEGRKGNVEKRVVRTGGEDAADAVSAVPVGQWPNVPDNIRKRVRTSQSS